MFQYNDLGLFLLRLAIAVIFSYHSLPKIKKSRAMASAMGWPPGAVLALGLVEVLSSLGLALGIYTQFAALLLAVIMIGAIYMKTMKWGVPFSAMDKTGWEFDLILLAGSIVILLGGGGSIGI